MSREILESQYNLVAVACLWWLWALMVCSGDLIWISSTSPPSRYFSRTMPMLYLIWTSWTCPLQYLLLYFSIVWQYNIAAVTFIFALSQFDIWETELNQGAWMGNVTGPLLNSPIIQGDSFHWYPPKKLKYGKHRLGESTLTYIVLDTPSLA